jgi:hypothetical protein
VWSIIGGALFVAFLYLLLWAEKDLELTSRAEDIVEALAHGRIWATPASSALS